jgi:hypothetical protein
VVVKAAPAAAFEMAQAKFLLQFLVIAFGDPALFSERDQLVQRNAFRQVRHPVFARFGFPAGPFDQQPFLFSRLVELVIPMCGADAHAGNAGAQGAACAFPPSDGFPGFGRQPQGQLFGR